MVDLAEVVVDVATAKTWKIFVCLVRVCSSTSTSSRPGTSSLSYTSSSS